MEIDLNNIENISKYYSTMKTDLFENISQSYTIFSLLCGIKIKLFDYLENESNEFTNLETLIKDLKIVCSERNFCDFLDKLFVNGYLERKEILENSKYKNSKFSSEFLVSSKPNNIIPFLKIRKKMIKNLLNYPKFLLDKEKYLKEFKFEENEYKNDEKTYNFLLGMINNHKDIYPFFAEKFDFSKYKSFLDVGGGLGYLSMLVKKNNPHLDCINYDLKKIEHLVKKYQQDNSLNENCFKIVSGDMFIDEFPKSDVIMMSNVLHDWNYEKKLILFKKACSSINYNGIFICMEMIIEDDRKNNSIGLDSSIDMHVACLNGYHMSLKDVENISKIVGFKKVENLQIYCGVSGAVCFK